MANNWFNVCALAVLAVLIGVYYAKFSAPFKKFRIFEAMLLLAAVSTLASLANNALAGLVPNLVLVLLNTVYFLAHGLIPPALVLYVCSLTDLNLQGWRKLVPALLPAAFSELLVLTSWYSGALFSIDAEGLYHRGPLMVVLYGVTAYHFAAVGVRLYILRDRIPRGELFSVAGFLVLSTAAVGIQLFLPYMLVENFASAICLMISQLAVQNPEQITDSRTGFLNKTGFSTLTEPLFRRGISCELGFLMIDNYHELEKAYGFTRLESCVQLLTEFLRQHPGMIFARPNDGLFCFIREDLSRDRLWENLLADLEEDALSTKLRKEQIGVRLRLKIGTVSVPQNAASLEEFETILDLTARQQMQERQDILRLNTADMVHLHSRQRVDALVRRAVRDGALRVVYQPVYSVKEKRFVSAEALLRMDSSLMGQLSPGVFIPMAEDNGAIVQMTQYVLETVCTVLRTSPLRALGLQRIHINLSAVDCSRADLSERILTCVRNAGIGPDSLSVELTETSFNALSDSMIVGLTDLSRASVSIMVDDYGTGYSNLSRLCSLPVDIVKLDKSLVDSIHSSEKARIVLENTILMMQRLHKTVLVEGVENKEQAEFLAAMGIDYIQGYYYARPMELRQMEALFRRQSQDSAE